MEELRHVLRERCKNLILKLGLDGSDSYAALPLCRYLLSIPYALPLKHVVLVERPYYTNIFPFAASAMAYSPDLQHETTPAVHFTALDISSGDSEISYQTARDWFRDSWSYIREGVVLLNVCTTRSFVEIESERERVYVEEFIRDMIAASLMLTPEKEKVHIWALGSPAKHSASRIRSSTINSRGRVVTHDAPNPASFKHRKSDKTSLTFTLGCKSFTTTFRKIISQCIEGSRGSSESDYIRMSSGSDELNNLISRASSTGDRFKEVYEYFKSNQGPTVERNEEIFNRAFSEMQAFVVALSSARIRTLFLGVSEPQSTSKPSYYNNRTRYNASEYSRGTSAKKSGGLTTPSKKMNVGFGDSVKEELPTQSSAGDKPVETKKEEVTPSKPPRKPARGSSITSRAGVRSVSVGFADESEDEKPSPVQEAQDSDESNGSFEELMSKQEVSDMSLVADFLDPSNEDYDIIPHVREAVLESSRTKRANAPVVKDVLRIIRKAKGTDAIANDLGYGNSGQVSVSSSIVQWVLNNAVTK
jgi:hypothetical protein